MSRQWGTRGVVHADFGRAPTVSASPSPGQSGVYDSIAGRQVLPSFWHEEDEEQSADQPVVARAVLPKQPVQPKRNLWQVALQLRGDELSRLWRRNSVHLAGRVFVWSDYSHQWVQLHNSPEFAQVHFADPLPIAQTEPASMVANGTQKSGASARTQNIVDVTSQARPYLGYFPSRWAFGLAASLVTLVGVAALLPARKTTSPQSPASPGVVMQATLHEPESRAPSKPEPIPVSSLPLVGGTRESTAVARAVNEVHASAGARGDSNSVLGAFNPVAARKVLSRAAWQARHCASGELSGSVLVTYEPTGAPSDVRINALAGDLSRSGCIVNAFRGARIAPFAGKRLVVKKSF
jgi:hypothetical protein